MDSGENHLHLDWIRFYGAGTYCDWIHRLGYEKWFNPGLTYRCRTVFLPWGIITPLVALES